MSIKPTIIALILAVLSAAGAMVVYKADQKAARVPARSRPLIAADRFPAEKISRIELVRRDQPAMVFEGVDGQWMQTAPFPHPVDPYSIEQFISMTRELQPARTLTGSEQRQQKWLSSVRLAPPDAVVKFSWPGGEVAVELGLRTAGQQAYLRIAGEDAVHVVKQDLHDRAIVMDPKEWRDRSLFTHVGVDSDRITRVVGEDRMVLAREGKQWVMIEPARTRIDPIGFDDFLQSIATSRSSGFIADQPTDIGRFGLAPPAGSLEIVAGARTQRMLIGSPMGVGTDDRFGIIEGRPTVVRISKPVLDALFRRSETLVDPRATGVYPPDVKTIRISGPDGDFRMERDLDRWLALDHDRVVVPTLPVEELLTQLTDVRAQEIGLLGSAPFPAESQIGFIVLSGFDGRPLDTVRIVKDPATGKLWLDNGDGVKRLYPATMTLRLSPTDYSLARMTR